MKLNEILWIESNSHTKKKRKVSLAVLIFGKKVFIVKRSFDSSHGGKWGFPGGGISRGESSLEAVRRECEEEIGVIPIGLRKLAQNERITWFMGKLLCDPFEYIRLNGEHDDWALVDEESMLGYDMIEGMREIIVKVLSGEEDEVV